MRLRDAAAGGLIVLTALALGACGVPTTSDPDSPASSAAGTSDSPADSTAASSASPPSTVGPDVPAETAVAAPVDPSLMPTASGKFGDKPTITVPDTPPPNTLQRVVLSQGDGPVSKAGDWLEVNYLGQVWGGDVFDNSYDRGSTFTVQVGGPQQMVVPGWDIGLRGVAQGSRILLSFPPEDGYGAAGNPPDISGTDTLIFVVDLVRVITAGEGGQSDATPQSTPAGLPTVEGELGAAPTVQIPSGLPEPAEAKVVILAKGTGQPTQAGNVLVQYVVTSWDGSQHEQSWPDPTENAPAGATGPRSLPLQEGSPFAPLIGVPLGSRALVVMPPDSTNGTPSLAWVIDLVAQQNVLPTGTESESPSSTDDGPPTEAPTS